MERKKFRNQVESLAMDIFQQEMSLLSHPPYSSLKCTEPFEFSRHLRLVTRGTESICTHLAVHRRSNRQALKPDGLDS